MIERHILRTLRLSPSRGIDSLYDHSKKPNISQLIRDHYHKNFKMPTNRNMVGPSHDYHYYHYRSRNKFDLDMGQKTIKYNGKNFSPSPKIPMCYKPIDGLCLNVLIEESF